MRFIRRHRLGIAVGGTIAAAALFATTAFADPGVTVGQEDADALRSTVHSTGSLITARDGDSTTEFGSGTTTAGQDDVPDGNDQFRVASNTKMFVSTVVLQLVEDGKLALDDPIGQHLPGVMKGEGNDENKITVRHLLQHTNGLADNLDVQTDPKLQWNPPSLQEMADIGMEKGSQFEPGTKYQYCNTEYSVLGLLIEKLTGQRFSDVVDERFVQPLGLEETSFANPGDKEMSGPHFRGYLGADPALFEVSGHEPGIWSTAGAMVSSGSDMTTFVDALMRGELLGDEMMQELQTTYDKSQYGLGVQAVELECGAAWGHTGQILGYMSFTFTNKEGRSVFTGFNTTATSLTDFSEPLARILNKSICGVDSTKADFSEATTDELANAEEQSEAMAEQKAKEKN